MQHVAHSQELGGGGEQACVVALTGLQQPSGRGRHALVQARTQGVGDEGRGKHVSCRARGVELDVTASLQANGVSCVQTAGFLA